MYAIFGNYAIDAIKRVNKIVYNYLFLKSEFLKVLFVGLGPHYLSSGCPDPGLPRTECPVIGFNEI